MAPTGSAAEPKEQGMFPNTHPDIMGQLVNDRIASLRADAERLHAGRPVLARRRPARIAEPAADLSRVDPAQVPETAEDAKADRAA
jgi:hypothetical protein